LSEKIEESQNQMIGHYFYNGDGKRVKKYVPATGETTLFVYDASGKVVAEYSTIVTPPSEAKVSYLTTDHLGTPRVITDQAGNVTSRRDFHPFGEEIYAAQRTQGLGYVGDTVRQKFTSYERDLESNLDFAQARYYSNQHGRFTSTDQILIKKDRLFDPQRLNLYAYVRNNPFKFVDTTGEDLILANRNARTTFRQVMMNGLSQAERNNIRVLANGRVVLRNPTAINTQNASYAYQQIAGIDRRQSKSNNQCLFGCSRRNRAGRFVSRRI
jgi:RHS repeat-associated protein